MAAATAAAMAAATAADPVVMTAAAMVAEIVTVETVAATDVKSAVDTVADEGLTGSAPSSRVTDERVAEVAYSASTADLAWTSAVSLKTACRACS